MIHKLLYAGIAALSLVTWKPEYAQQPPEVRNWYETRELNPETQKRLQVRFKSCCEKSEVVKTQFRVDHDTGGDTWWWLDLKTNQWRVIPADVIHWDDPAPDNQPTLFIWDDIEMCFFPPGGSG